MNAPRLVTCVADDGRLSRQERFASEALGAALARLVERWADNELDGPLREPMLNSLLNFSSEELLRQDDSESFASQFTDDLLVVEHQSLTPPLRGGAAIIGWARWLSEVFHEVTSRFHDVRVERRCAWWSWRREVSATGVVPDAHAARGGVGSDGRTQPIEMFPTDRLDSAWVCSDDMQLSAL